MFLHPVWRFCILCEVSAPCAHSDWMSHVLSSSRCCQAVAFRSFHQPGSEVCLQQEIERMLLTVVRNTQARSVPGRDSWQIYFVVFHDHTFQEGCQLGLVSTLLVKALLLADLLKTSNVSESYLNKGVIAPVDKSFSSLLRTPEPGEHFWCVSELQLSFQPGQHPQLVTGEGS